MLELALSEKLAELSLALIALLTFHPVQAQVNPWQGYEMLRRAASCESTGDVNKPPRQFNDDGSILWGHNPKLWNLTGATTTDVGELQISLKYHGAEAAALGLDIINSEEDNITMGKILYDREGMVPWTPSKNCWKKT